MLPISLWLLPVCAALLCWLAWIPQPFTPLLFLAFVPMLYLEQRVTESHIPQQRRQLWQAAFLFFLLFNLLSTGWIFKSTIVGMLFACITNALLMCLPFMLFHVTRQKFGNRIGYISFVAYWLAFEHLHQRWELAWTWLNLGNALSQYPVFIQWYEYTGTGGGTLWVLIVNLVVFLAINQYQTTPNLSGRKERGMLLFRTSLIPLLLLIVPILISVQIFNNYSENGTNVEIAIVQPSEDPYQIPDTEAANKQVDDLLKLAETVLTPETQYLIFPESALPDAVWLNDFDQDPHIQQLRQWVQQYPKLKLVSGITALMHYPQPKATPSAQPYLQKSGSYDIYNSSMQIDTSQHEQWYHKSKLVPGVEKIPYRQLFGFISPLIESLGGGTGGFATQPERTVFFGNDSLGIAPVICYESIFGQYLTEYVQKGAQLIFVMTNDGWWGNTAGYQQHLHYASLRAIECRRSIARAANTGISCFINQRGIIEEHLDWQEKGAIVYKLEANTAPTFYVTYGDFIGRTAVLLSSLFILLTFVTRFTPHFANKLRVPKK